MSSNCMILSFILCNTLIFTLKTQCHRPLAHATSDGGGGGSWQLLHKSIGISALHMQLLNNDRVVIYDRTDFGRSNLSLPDGKCRNDPHDTSLTTDCTAHSVEYDVATNSIRPLMVQTDVWCSSGAVVPDGRLIQTGGYNDGERVVRIFRPCGACDWQEIGAQLLTRRWYATNHILPNGRVIIMGGRRQFNYEFFPKTNLFRFPFLEQTNDPKAENNLYPFIFLNVDGNLFIFANNQAILFDYTKNRVIKTYPSMPGGEPRNYPSTGSSVLLPLKNTNGGQVEVEVLVCGGAPRGAFEKAMAGQFVGALNTCGRIKITDPNPQWVMETMPLARVMGDMVLLPNGHVLIINGAGSGTAGWEYGRDPVLKPVIFRPDNPSWSRFEVQSPTTIPRMYHSTAILLRDGRVIVGGSNPHIYYNFTNVLYPTELSLEAFSPPYLDPTVSDLRPNIISPPAFGTKIGYEESLAVRFSIAGPTSLGMIEVTMIAPPFNTHSFSMNQRQLFLTAGDNVTTVGKSTYQVQVKMPDSVNLTPQGYYMVFVVHQDIPSPGIWLQIQ